MSLSVGFQTRVGSIKGKQGPKSPMILLQKKVSKMIRFTPRDPEKILEKL
jgi:hypothetical protein